MCGIAGALSLGPELGGRDRKAVEAMTAALDHRGPDARGLLVEPLALLGNTRLKITDLSEAAALPMSGSDDGVWIAYNGAVTNFRELVETFGLDRRAPLRSGSDAEVVLRLYETLGIDGLRHLSGMFAFCIYDARRRKAYLVRDFYGQRPVFYRVKGGRLHFASEIKAFLELPDFDKRLDYEALHHYFSLAYLPGKHTPFAELRELEGGHYLEIDLGTSRVQERVYHRLRYETNEERGEQETAAELRELLLDSVRRSMDVDVPVGLMLSGGIDTGGLLAMIKHLGLSRKLHTFSLGMTEASFDETSYQRLLVDFAKPIHHEISVRPDDVLERLYEHLACLDEPSGDGAAVPFYLLAEEAKGHVKVLLSGEGGDEIFNAYETHRAFRAREFYRRWCPGPLRRLIRGAAHALPASYGKLSWDFVLKRFTEGAELSAPEAHFFWRHVLSEEEKRRLMPGRRGFPPTSGLFRKLYESAEFADGLNRISQIDLRCYFIDDLMVKNDRMMMAHSIEGRYPYMDRKVVDFAETIPTRMKVRGLRGRRIQKLAFEGLVPKLILARTNMGLEMPHSRWFLSSFRPFSEKQFSRENLSKSGLFDADVLHGMWREHLAGRRDNGRPLWCVLNFLIWFDLFVYNGDYKKHLTSPAGRDKTPELRVARRA